MKCPQCVTEMNLFKDSSRKLEGYSCPACAAETFIEAYSLDPENLPDDGEMFAQYGWAWPDGKRL